MVEVKTRGRQREERVRAGKGEERGYLLQANCTFFLKSMKKGQVREACFLSFLCSPPSLLSSPQLSPPPFLLTVLLSPFPKEVSFSSTRRISIVQQLLTISPSLYNPSHLPFLPFVASFLDLGSSSFGFLPSLQPASVGLHPLVLSHSLINYSDPLKSESTNNLDPSPQSNLPNPFSPLLSSLPSLLPSSPALFVVQHAPFLPHSHRSRTPPLINRSSS